MADDNERSPPRQELLLKMLNMTTADNDGQALVAIRKANKLLSEAGWTWERLLAGKITVVEDPFAKIQTPKSGNRNDDDDLNIYHQPTPPPAPWKRPPPPPPPPAPPPRPMHRTYTYADPLDDHIAAVRAALDRTLHQNKPSASSVGAQPISTRTNQYPGWCFCCGENVPVRAGCIFDPSTKNSKAVSKWFQICTKCNREDTYISPSPAPRKKSLHSSIDPAVQSGPAPKLGDL